MGPLFEADPISDDADARQFLHASTRNKPDFFYSVSRSHFVRSKAGEIMTKLTNTNELADAVNATVTALIDNGHNEHAEVVQHSIANILRSGSPITIDTLHQWLGLIDVAHCLISDAGDECTADETAEHASSYVRKEIDAINVAAGEAPTNYGQLHNRLNDAYAIIADLPNLAHPALHARVRQVLNMLDDLTFDTFDEYRLKSAGIVPGSVVQATKEAAYFQPNVSDETLR